MSKIFACAAVLGALTLSSAAFADQPSNPPPAQPGANASACGAVHGAFASVNGNFGFLGQVGGTPGYHDGATGQQPGATGSNNSHTDCQTNNPNSSDLP
jgi:opacity protein-like surface antigen